MASTDTMRAILSTAEPKDEYSTSLVHPWIGDGLLLSSGKKWARNRRLLTRAFHFETLKPYVKLFNESAKSLIDKWKMKCSAEVQDDNSIEIYKDISMLTLDSLLKCIFSIESNCQHHESHHPYLESVSTLSDIFIKRLLFLPYHINLIFHLSPSGWRWRRACHQVHTFAADVIRKRRHTLEAIQGSSSHGCEQYEGHHQVYFLDMLIMAKDENGNGFSDQEIQDEVNTFMFAGHDTTASSISWMLYTMAKYPEYQQKCRQEIDQIVKDRKSEEIEWHVHNNPLYGHHHNENNWQDVNAFKPERFSQENSRDRPPYMFIPFSAGPRNCIGQHFAMQEMKVVLALLLRNFDFSIDEEGPAVIKIHSIVLRALHGIHLKIKPIVSS
ncbi:cytochrome P450 4F2-like [Amphiura filiformis]|uniref:cytochrome P450 4F2-like n=1 Tax=Amphiura filiformis TaxID=82378 RepID=UPI003B21323F